jgi:hypothetical protein
LCPLLNCLLCPGHLLAHLRPCGLAVNWYHVRVVVVELVDLEILRSLALDHQLLAMDCLETHADAALYLFLLYSALTFPLFCRRLLVGFSLMALQHASASAYLTATTWLDSTKFSKYSPATLFSVMVPVPNLQQ